MFDAVLLIAFGGPQGPADVRPFLENVLKGRRVSPARVDEVVRHYDLFGGVSPITEYTLRQAEGLRERLTAAGTRLPVYVGMRNWHPYLVDTLEQMHADGVRRAIGFITSAFHSYSSCQQYRENVEAARLELLTRRPGAVPDITYVGSWFDHPGFIAANVRHVESALARLPSELASAAKIVFTAHSIPLPMAERSRYREELTIASAAVASRVGRDWSLVYQSRSGRPEDPWLEPDVRDHVRAERARGVKAVVLCPIGFICDHIEVLYDLDQEAAAVCAAVGLPMARAEAVNADPLFLDAMADVVRRTVQRYSGRPLALASNPAHEPGRDRAPAGGPSRSI